MPNRFRDLAEDHSSGATELIQRLLAACEGYLMGEAYGELRDGIEALEHAQLSMPSFHAMLQILKSEFLPRVDERGDNSEAIGYLASLRQVLDESGNAVSAAFAGLFKAPVRIATLSRSGTVLLALRRLLQDGRLSHLTVLESRPMNEGQNTVREFNGVVPASLMIDAASAVAAADCDCAVTGADCVSADGYLLNKTGTMPLALCCRQYGKPLYVLCDSLKFSPQLRDDIIVEDSPQSDVVEKRKQDTFEVWNRYFEWMPVDLVTAFVTEQGVFAPDQLSKLAGE